MSTQLLTCGDLYVSVNCLFIATGKLNGIQLTDCGYQTFFKTKKKNIVIISRRKNVWPFIEINLVYTLHPRMLCAKFG